VFTVPDGNNFKGLGRYKVASIYLDNHELRNYFDKVNGLPRRLKTRVRFYPQSADENFCNVEFKYKFCDKSIKRKTVVDQKQIQNLFSHGRRVYFCHQNRVLADFAQHIHINNLKPVIRIDYLRYAFFGKDNPSLRLTIDTDVRCCRYRADFWSCRPYIPAIPEGLFILEVKTKDSYPYWLSSLLSKYGLKRIAISKYVCSMQALARNSTLSF